MLCFTILFHVFSNEGALEIDAKIMKNRCQNDALKITKILCPNGSQIIENWSKIRPGGDQWPLILRFWAFWSDAKNTWVFDASPVVKKSEKSAQVAA